METLLPAILKERWRAVEQGQSSEEQYLREKELLLTEYRIIWSAALSLEPDLALSQSLLRELGNYLECKDVNELEKRCRAGASSVEEEWARGVVAGSRESIERFYDQSQAYLFDLVWWHTLAEEDSPLAYVLALRFAQAHQCASYLDFGSGISSGTILFARHGFEGVSADISSSLLRFSQWRFDRRGLNAEAIDLKERPLPGERFDFVTAMDVWEHLTDPEAAADQVAKSLRAGGYLFGRFALEPDDQRPQHIVHDFGRVFQRLRTLGFKQVWEDDWLWGHRAFQKQRVTAHP
jgi:SAM-dependent methyltransferase